MPLSSVAGNPYIQVLIPVVFLVVASVAAIPYLAFFLIFHPVSVLASDEPINLIRRKFFYYAWSVMSPMLDPGDKPHKAPLLAKCYGVVLEIGPGVGDNIKYYTRSNVERLILVEPNTNMHPELRDRANKAGYFDSDGSLLLLGCGGAASDELALSRAGIGPSTIDSLASIHVLCGIPNPDAAVELYRRLLKPGGLLVFYEHVRSEERFIADWQSWYTRYIWKNAFDGCELDRPTGAWIIGGPQVVVHNTLITGKELVNGISGLSDGVVKRWKQCVIEAPAEQQKFAITPHVKGWAIKV